MNSPRVKEKYEKGVVEFLQIVFHNGKPIIEVKRYLRSLEYKKIHTCPKDCVSYKNGFVALWVCPAFGLSRFKKKPK